MAPSKYRSSILRMYFTPAWMFGSSLRISPTFIALPVDGMTCITPIAPEGLLRFWFRRDSW